MATQRATFVGLGSLYSEIWICLLSSVLCYLQSAVSLLKGNRMAVKEKLEAVLNVALRVPSIMLLDVLYRWDVSSFFQQIQRSSLSNNPLFQYKYLALNMHYVGKCTYKNANMVLKWSFPSARVLGGLHNSKVLPCLFNTRLTFFLEMSNWKLWCASSMRALIWTVWFKGKCFFFILHFQNRVHVSFGHVAYE